MNYINQGEKTRKEFLQEAKLYGYEIFTADVVKAFQTDFIAKSKSGELDDEERLEKAVELHDLKRQIVVNDDLTKSLLFYREPLVEWFDKAQRTGRYADNPTNRRLHRVGMPYKKREGHADGEEGKEQQKESTIKHFDVYNNGNQSKLNVHFSDGKQFTRTITAQEAIKLSKTRDRAYLKELMEKYKEPQGIDHRGQVKKESGPSPYRKDLFERKEENVMGKLNHSDDVDDFISKLVYSSLGRDLGLTSRELKNSNFYKKYSDGDTWRGEYGTTIMNDFKKEFI